MKGASFIFLTKSSSPWAVWCWCPCCPQAALRKGPELGQESLPQAAPIFEAMFAFKSQITTTQPRLAVRGHCCS